MSAAQAHVPHSGSTTLPAGVLEEMAAGVLCAAGADRQAAAIVARSLIESDLRGVSSHGFMRLPEYLAAIADGRIAPAARPRLRAEGGATLQMDGCRCFGQVAVSALGPAAVKLARAQGVSLSMLRGVSHVGRLGECVEAVAQEGCLGLAWCACGDPYGNVVPFGGRESRLGTNPIAFALPASSGPAAVADFSTSAVAEGKVRLYAHRGRSVPDGWLIGADGHPTNDPRALYQGGALLPAGGHKGYALGLLVEAMGGILAGAGCATLGESPGNGLVLIAIDPSVGPLGEQLFGQRMDQVLRSLTDCPPAGAQSVKAPGTPEREEMVRRRADGIAIAAGTWLTVVEAATTVGVELQAPPIS